MNHILAINRKSSMKRLALALLFSALFVIRALSQGTVTVTATITDSQGTVWTNAACTAIYAIPAGVNHITNTVTGQGISPTSIPCTADSSGHFSITLVSTTNIGPPISGTTFTVCANLPNAQCYTTSPINIGASTQDVSAQITATIPPPTIAGVLIPQAYADSEVNQSVATEYLRITDNTLRCYTGTWGACGAGSGGPPTGAAGGVLSGTYPNPGYAVQPLVPANNLHDVTSTLTSLANLGADPCTGQITNGNGIFCVDNFTPALYPGIYVSPAAWSSGTYAACTSVSYSGAFYMAVGTTTGVTPGTNSAIWTPVPLGLTPLQTDCANAYATSYLLNNTTISGACPVLYFGGANHANGSNGSYFTNITVQLAPASWTGSCAISLQGSGMTTTYLVQDQVVTLGTVNLPTPTGGGNNFKRFSVRDMTINAAGNAPYALQILGSHYQSIFETSMVARRDEHGQRNSESSSLRHL